MAWLWLYILFMVITVALPAFVWLSLSGESTTATKAAAQPKQEPEEQVYEVEWRKAA